MSHLNYNHLYYFWHVYKQGSVVGAAEALFLTPQTITGQIKALEERLQGKLFKRKGRGIEPSELGELVFRYADKMFTLSQEMLDIVNYRKESNLLFDVGVADALSKRLVSGVLDAAGSNHSPPAICLPIDGHQAQNGRMRAQWEAGRPLSKQLWRALVVAKIRWQGAVLAANGHSATAFDHLARKVGSGDPENIEAQAARRYWPTLMGEAFRRERDAQSAHAPLNYGYAVMRAPCARAGGAAGLHPPIGVHHAHRGNPFALADDVIEPFRALVDALTIRLIAHDITGVTSEAKRAYAGLIAVDLMLDRPGASASVRASSSSVVAVGGAAFTPPTPVRPVLVISCAVRLIASRSINDGRRGITPRSARCAAAAASAPAAGGVSMIVSAKPLASAASIAWSRRLALIGSTCGSSAVRRSLQAVALSCGSRSKRAVLIPTASAATAKFTASVVLPTPPF